MNITSQQIISRSIRAVERKVGRTFSYRQALAAGVSRADLLRYERAGYLVRLGQGLYSFAEHPTPQAEEPLLAATAHLRDEPHFISWWAALAHHGLTEQVPFTLSVAVKKARRDREIAGLRVHHVRLGPRKWAGFRRDAHGVFMATPEKAIIDCLDKPSLGGGLHEVVKAIGASDRYNPDRLVRLAINWPTQATVRRLGYVLETLGIANVASLRAQITRNGPHTPLQHSGADQGERSDAWWISDAVGVATLQEWARQ